QAEDGIRDFHVTGVQTCALPIYPHRVLLTKVLGALLAQPALVPAVIAVELLLFLPARQADLRSVDDHDVIARVDVGRVNRLVLALQETRRLGRDPAEDHPLGIDDMPLPLHTAGSGNKRTHENPFGLRCSYADRAAYTPVRPSLRTANQEDTDDCGDCQASAEQTRG